MAVGPKKGPTVQEVALVTGGSRGLGLAVTRSLLEAGLRVAIIGRDQERLSRTRKSRKLEFGAPVLAVRGDLGARGTATRVVAQTLRRLGRIDTVVAAGGDVPIGPLASLDHAAWHAAFSGKLLGHIALFREVEGHLRARGSGVLIALTGATGCEPTADNIAAEAVNAALQNVMNTLAKDLGTAGIRVLTVSPGPFLTDRLHNIASRAKGVKSDAELVKRFSQDVPLNRVGEPWEFGALVKFLQSPQAGFLHGTTIDIDGDKRRAA